MGRKDNGDAAGLLSFNAKLDDSNPLAPANLKLYNPFEEAGYSTEATLTIIRSPGAQGGGAELLDQGWFGPVVSPPVAARYGDVALVPFEPISFHDPADSGPFPLVCRHGALTAEEMLVPLLAGGR